MPIYLHIVVSYIFALLAMALFTLLERKVLGYTQQRKGPNKVGLIGIPQPVADAAKLLTKETTRPTLSHKTAFMMAPMIGLFLSTLLWSIYPHYSPVFFMKYSILFFLCISSLNVYTTFLAGWVSNSKYALLGAIRSVAQTISYEVSMALALLCILILHQDLNITTIMINSYTPVILLSPMLFMVWFATCLAETNRAPFDLAEGESELVSGFNTEYSSGSFAMIFMAEYMNILIMSLITTTLFLSNYFACKGGPVMMTSFTVITAYMFLWVRTTYPRMRYDQLMGLTWKTFLPFVLIILLFNLCCL